jgi:hypothetical protein
MDEQMRMIGGYRSRRTEPHSGGWGTTSIKAVWTTCRSATLLAAGLALVFGVADAYAQVHPLYRNTLPAPADPDRAVIKQPLAQPAPTIPYDPDAVTLPGVRRPGVDTPSAPLNLDPGTPPRSVPAPDSANHVAKAHRDLRPGKRLHDSERPRSAGRPPQRHRQVQSA